MKFPWRFTLFMIAYATLGFICVMTVGGIFPSVLAHTKGINVGAVSAAVGFGAGMVLGIGWGLLITLYKPKISLPSFKFSLRTLLITTTLVAAVLGLIMFAIR